MNIRTIYQLCKAKLLDGGIETVEIEARAIVQNVLGITREDLILKSEETVSTECLKQIDEIIKQRCVGKPLSKIFGEKEFWSLTFKVTEDTLDPRPDSETVIEAILKYMPERNAEYSVLDIGTGTGCLAIAMLSEYRNAKGLAIDISEKALAVADANTTAHGLSDRLTLQNIGWTDLDENDIYDIVISNPPYIATGEKQDMDITVTDYDPSCALFAGLDGLDAYRDLARILPHILKPETGRAFFEIGYLQAADVSAIFEGQGLTVLAVAQDIASRDRCVILKK